MEPFAVGRRLLDFGFGPGYFWQAALKAGWDAYGCDISVAGVEQARQFWHTDRLFETDSPRLRSLAADGFDVINASQVFEHLTSPVQTTGELRLALTSGGVLALDVPNVASLPAMISRPAVLDPAHMIYWSAVTLHRLLEQNGFRVVEMLSGYGGTGLLSRFLSTGRAADVALRLRRITTHGNGLFAVAVRTD